MNFYAVTRRDRFGYTASCLTLGIEARGRSQALAMRAWVDKVDRLIAQSGLPVKIRLLDVDNDCLVVELTDNDNGDSVVRFRNQIRRLQRVSPSKYLVVMLTIIATGLMSIALFAIGHKVGLTSMKWAAVALYFGLVLFAAFSAIRSLRK